MESKAICHVMIHYLAASYNYDQNYKIVIWLEKESTI